MNTEALRNMANACLNRGDEMSMWHKPLMSAANEIDTLRKENKDLKELLDRYENGYQGSCYACEKVGETNVRLREALEKIFYKGHMRIAPLDDLVDIAKAALENEE